MNIFVSNISFHTTETILQEMFSKFGVVKSVRIIMDKLTGKAKGFGFVEMPSNEEAQKAIDSLHNTEIQGRLLNVSVARPSDAQSNNRNNRFEKKW